MWSNFMLKMYFFVTILLDQVPVVTLVKEALCIPMPKWAQTSFSLVQISSNETNFLNLKVKEEHHMWCKRSSVKDNFDKKF